MARLLAKKARKHGFTLVELLIVVAIIGVLSTIGVPTFRRMVQKSKKSEAKVALGGLYTTEQAFASEYGVFGNNLRKIGFEMDGNSPIYRTGFMTVGCAGNPTVIPAAGAGPQTNLYNAFPTYGSAGNYNVLTTAQSNTASNLNGSADGKVGYTVCGGAAGAMYGNGINATFNQFTAIATGVIAPGVAAIGVAADNDVWTITQQRIMVNNQDGVR